MKELLRTKVDVFFSLSNENTIQIEQCKAGLFLSIPTEEARISIIKNRAGDYFFGVVSALFCCAHVSIADAEKLHALLPGVEFKDERESLTDVGGAA